MSHNTLEAYFKNIFAMTYHHKYSISDLESMMPFELDVYIAILNNYIAVKEEEALQASKQAEAIAAARRY